MFRRCHVCAPGNLVSVHCTRPATGVASANHIANVQNLSPKRKRLRRQLGEHRFGIMGSWPRTRWRLDLNGFWVMAIFLGLKVQNENRAITFPLHVKVKEPPVSIKKEPAFIYRHLRTDRFTQGWMHYLSQTAGCVWKNTFRVILTTSGCFRKLVSVSTPVGRFKKNTLIL